MLDLWVVFPTLWWIGARVEVPAFLSCLGALFPIELPGREKEPLKLPVFTNVFTGLAANFP